MQNQGYLLNRLDTAACTGHLAFHGVRNQTARVLYWCEYTVTGPTLECVAEYARSILLSNFALSRLYGCSPAFMCAQEKQSLHTKNIGFKASVEKRGDRER